MKPTPVSKTFLGLSVAIVISLLGSMLMSPTPALMADVPVNVWMTTAAADGLTVVKGLEPQANVTFVTDTPNGNQVIQVDENLSYQTMEGFGASMTDSSAWLLNSSGLLTQTARDTVMTKLFDPVNGIGVSFLRNPMGASDLARYLYTYDDNAADAANSSLPNFSIAHDLVDVAPLTAQAKTLNPNLKVMGSPWSPPAWMKDNNSMIRGSLLSQYYPHFATYFVKYIQAYAAQGIPINYISLQNEPNCCDTHPPMAYPGMNMTSAEAITILKNHVLPALAANNLSTKVLLLDFNWGDSAWVEPLLQDTTIRNSSQVAGVAWHGYWPVNPSDYGKQTLIHDAYPPQQTFFTERSGGTWITNQIKQDFEDIVGVTRNWSKNFVKWGLALDQNHGPHYNGCGTCTGLVTVHNGDAMSGQVDYTIEYYTMGHISKFVTPGAVRIDSSNNPSVWNVAFKNPDGSKVLIAFNDTTAPQTFKVLWGGQSFNYTLASYAGVTFKWTGTQTPPNQPTNTPTPTQKQFYVRSGNLLSETAGTAAVSDTLPNAGGKRYLTTPHLPVIYTSTGVNATYDATLSTKFNLYVDVPIGSGDAIQVQVQYDFTGDGVWDRTETYKQFALDTVTGWQSYTETTGLVSSSGTFSNLVNGKVRIQVWNALGQHDTHLRVSASAGDGSQSIVKTPFR
jgi:glucosylceramidase